VKDVEWTADGAALLSSAQGKPVAVRIDGATGSITGESSDQTVFRRLGLWADGSSWALTWGRGPVTWAGTIGEPNYAAVVPQTLFGDGETNEARTTVALRDDGGDIYRWPMGEPVQKFTSNLDAIAVDVFPDGLDLVAGGRKSVSRHDDTGRRKWSAPVDKPVLDVAVSPDGALVAAGTSSGALIVLDGVTGEHLLYSHAHTERIAAVAFDPSGEWIVTGSWDGDLCFWGLGTLRRPAEELVAETQAAWGLTLDQALNANIY
jgi:WD40 repeat protein